MTRHLHRSIPVLLSVCVFGLAALAADEKPAYTPSEYKAYQARGEDPSGADSHLDAARAALGLKE